MAAKLFKAIRDGDVDDLQQLIDKGANVNETDKKGVTPLIECAIQGFGEGIEILLSAGNCLRKKLMMINNKSESTKENKLCRCKIIRSR